ncbi:MAG: hypothetical protein IPL69_19780 [Saprospiraceae bacterium]|nr:hypothetical protein [Candidatus Brachybacter algidus]
MEWLAGGGTVNYNCKLFRTRDGGNTWENTDLPFGYSINGLWMTDTNRVYICGEWGSILLYGDTSNLSVGIPEHDQYDNKIVVYPNPASKILQLKIPEQSARVDLLLYFYRSLNKENNRREIENRYFRIGKWNLFSKAK